MSLRKLHGISALIILLYALIHILNHLVGLAGVEAHIAFMRAFRTIYRAPIVEVVLLAAVCFQVLSGLTFVVRGWKERKGLIPWLQAGSGAYLAFFFLNHVGAVLYGRSVLNLDTNFYFAAAGFYVPPFQFFFAPYYFLAVLALFTHLGCALYWNLPSRTIAIRDMALKASIGVGGVISLVIVLMLAGKLYPVKMPHEYKATYQR